MRIEKGLTQQQVSDYLLCDQSLYSKYERGDRDVPLTVIIKLARLYETSVDYLVRLTDNKEPHR